MRYSLVLLLLVLLPTAYALTPNGTLNYTRYASNPLVYDEQSQCTTWNGAGGETTSFIEGNRVYGYDHRHNAGDSDSRIFFWNNTNPYNYSSCYIIHDFDGLNYPYLASTGDGTIYRFGWGTNSTPVYHMFIGNAAVGAASAIRHYTSTNKINWTLSCTLTGTGSGLANPALYYHNDTGVWDMLVDFSPWGSSRVLTSNNGCDFTEIGTLGVMTPDLVEYGGVIVVYGTVYDGGSNNFTMNVYNGTSLTNLSLVTSNALSMSAAQAWEVGNGATVDTDPSIMLVPSSSQQYFDRQFYLYYMGNQRQVGVAYDTDNRSFWAAHNILYVTNGTGGGGGASASSVSSVNAAINATVAFFVIALFAVMLYLVGSKFELLPDDVLFFIMFSFIGLGVLMAVIMVF